MFSFLRDRYLAAVALAAVIQSAIAGGAAAIPIIDTSAVSNGGAAGFGEAFGAPTALGQTFTVTGPETRLNSFSFRLDDDENPDVLDFGAYVYQWVPSGLTGHISGPALYSSLGHSTAVGGPQLQVFTFNTGGINLTAGGTYIAFLTVIGHTDGTVGTATVSAANSLGNPYAGGQLYVMHSATSLAHLTSNWTSLATGWDAWFIATFSDPAANQPVPTPSTALLLSFGLVGLSRRKLMGRSAHR